MRQNKQYGYKHCSKVSASLKTTLQRSTTITWAQSHCRRTVFTMIDPNTFLYHIIFSGIKSTIRLSSWSMCYRKKIKQIFLQNYYQRICSNNCETKSVSRKE